MTGETDLIPEQLQLDLGDRNQYLLAFMKKQYLGSNSSWQIFLLKDQLWLGIRTSFIDTDYDYLEKISKDDAQFLLNDQKEFYVGKFHKEINL